MAEWKKIIVSGSQAELAGVTGSFTGSFFGDGSGLTGVSSFSVSGDTNNRVITADGSGGGVGEANLTFDGSTLNVAGTVDANIATIGVVGDFTIQDDGSGNTTLAKAAGRAVRIGDTAAAGNSVEVTVDDAANEVKLFASTTSISGSTVNVATAADTINLSATTINIPNVAAGTDNTVVVYNGTTLVTDEIDPKVWAGNLVDKQGTPVQFQVATFNDADTLVGSANFTFNNSTLSITGNVDASGPVTGSNLMLDGTLADGAGETTVLVIDGSGNVKSDEIDSRVWGSTLVDGSGLGDGYITFASDSDTITGASDFTYDGVTKTLSVTSATITGDLTVTGTVTELQVTNLNIDDQFILLNSGSGEPLDTGIVFGGVQDGTTGAALFWNVDTTRLAYTNTGIAWNATTATPSGYLTIAYNVDGGQTAEAYVGNIKIEGGQPFIYV